MAFLPLIFQPEYKKILLTFHAVSSYFSSVTTTFASVFYQLMHSTFQEADLEKKKKKSHSSSDCPDFPKSRDILTIILSFFSSYIECLLPPPGVYLTFTFTAAPQLFYTYQNFLFIVKTGWNFWLKVTALWQLSLNKDWKHFDLSEISRPNTYPGSDVGGIINLFP